MEEGPLSFDDPRRIGGILRILKMTPASLPPTDTTETVQPVMNGERKTVMDPDIAGEGTSPPKRPTPTQRHLLTGKQEHCE